MVKLIIGYWFMGLCNNIGYVVALTAAHDLLAEISEPQNNEAEKKDFKRDCNVISTGAVLLADIVPSIFVKLVAPFLPLFIKIRFMIAILLTASGFLLIAFGFQTLNSSWVGIIGVIFMSLSSGLGESSALAYTAFFPTDNALSAWSSGTGGAGVIGATMYAVLREIGLSIRYSMIIMLMWPIIMAISFYVLIPHPKIDRKKSVITKIETATKEEIKSHIPQIEDPHSFKAKLLIIKGIFFIYTLPF
ncbi:hypothetical protein O3M35_010839 [Rhynocoris fuscipes]|uniref:Battenin n=1 Tax=Rhynocoris fuscipes TaxID=488301 RepID=A0AAW1D0I3_9HEMI